MSSRRYYELIICLCLFALISFLLPDTVYKKPELPSHCMNISGESVNIGNIALSEGIEYDRSNRCIVKGAVPESVTTLLELQRYLHQKHKL